MPVSRLVKAEDVAPEPYRLRTLKAPVLRGWQLKIFTWFMQTPLGSVAQRFFLRRSGVPQVTMDICVPEKPTFEPVSLFDPLQFSDDQEITEDDPRLIVEKALSLLPSASTGLGYAPSIRDYIEAYRTGNVTPLQVAQEIVSILERSPDCHWFISFHPEEVVQQGRASAERYASGAPLSSIDGVPFCAKDMLHALNHRTTCGTAHISHTVDDEHKEAPIITRLKSLGAVFLGKTNLHEIGLGVTGLNLVHGTAVNPWNRERYPGGSSSGGAAVVAAGLCPISIGSDGGGSIRIPSSFCGVFGMKLTHGREIDQCGESMDFTVCCHGPITNCVEDAILVYSLLSKKPSSTDTSITRLWIPKLTLKENPLTHVRVGVYWEWFNDSDVDVRTCCADALEALRSLGCEVVSIAIPELEYLRVSHTATISSEMCQTMHAYYSDKEKRKGMNPDVRMNLLVASRTKAQEYIQAQCIRTRMGIHFKKALSENVHCIVTPTTPMTAPPIHPRARSRGEHNLELVSKIMRYVPAANFLGMPSASIPVGHDSQGDGKALAGVFGTQNLFSSRMLSQGSIGINAKARSEDFPQSACASDAATNALMLTEGNAITGSNSVVDLFEHKANPSTDYAVPLGKFSEIQSFYVEAHDRDLCSDGTVSGLKKMVDSNC